MIGRFSLLSRLGAGGMGRVYLGRSPEGLLAAVKVIRSDLTDEPDFQARFRREVAAARLATGRYTAAVIAADADATPSWLATEYVPGLSLDEVVTAHGPLPFFSVTTMTAGVAAGLVDLHRISVIHRDLKPTNVLLLADGLRIIDFGVSHLAQASRLTRFGEVLGTPGFMAPEQAAAADSVGPASDVYALGAVCCYACTGEGPFGIGDTPTLMYRAVHEPPRLARVPQPLRELAAACLAKNPAERPSAEQVLAEVLPAGTTVAALFTDDWLPRPVLDDIHRIHRQVERLRGLPVPTAEPSPAPTLGSGTSARAGSPGRLPPTVNEPNANLGPPTRKDDDTRERMAAGRLAAEPAAPAAEEPAPTLLRRPPGIARQPVPAGGPRPAERAGGWRRPGSRTLVAVVVGVLLVALAGGVAAALMYGGATRPGPAATASQHAGPATAVSPSTQKPTCQFTDQRPALTEGASGDAVQQAQCELNASLSPSRFPALDITGVFGPQTVRRIRALEACTDIPVNGIIGPDTWAELDRWSVAPGYAC